MKKNQSLYEIANKQQGLFTAKQAETCGFSTKHHHYYIKNGEWKKEMRGIYRLSAYPANEQDLELMVWLLWTRGRDDKPQGVLSHDTAISLYELSDLVPVKIHMTVPPKFRKYNEPPKILAIHRYDLPEADITTIRGLAVTKPKQTFLDIINSKKIERDLVNQAFDEACSKGLLSSSERSVIKEQLNEC